MSKNDNFKDITLEEVARMVADGFASIEGTMATKEDLKRLEDRITIVEGRLTNMENRMDRLLDEILGIKAELKNVATHDDIKKLDTRVTAIEKAVFSAAS